ncbi:MAG TPA: hypothetical protein EYH41_04215 [Novosphingobium capsulatum]|nr:hypothetical protein [Novosphingobium capsulatum]
MIAALLAQAWAWLAARLAPLAWPICTALALLLVVQTVRIEGLRIWPIKIAGLRAERDQWRSAEHDWRRAAEIMRGSFDVLHDALQLQNAAVQRLKADGDTRKQAGKDALAATDPRNTERESLARAIEMASPSSSVNCRTPAAVMAAKGEL